MTLSGSIYLLERPGALCEIFYPFCLRQMPFLRLCVLERALLVHAHTYSRG
jgi:hypothetical protein